MDVILMKLKSEEYIILAQGTPTIDIIAKSQINQKTYEPLITW
ncbi:16148_t:CDS:2 [Gigaspora margarita]|uniref:16148_t:CDS:1 n=1 Tax=Gigaspora margarita TaxID=4874 RepID=A0ABN7V467_GIGMA|nr:16148_t:CDS:2 [Gigaspora margarita]